MGWADRGFHLDPAPPAALFDHAGNIGPTVWWNGEIVGGWAQRSDGEIVWRLLTDPGREPPPRSQRRPHGCRTGWATPGSPRASVPRWSGN